MGQRGRVNFRAANVSEIRLDLTTHLPDLDVRPLGLEISLNSERLCAFSLCRQGWLQLRIRVPEALAAAETNGEFELELRADRTWQPRPTEDETRDDRELSIAVCNIEVVGG
jgi:hypothetical protein